MRVTILTEKMFPPFDEGIKNFSFHLTQELARTHETLALSRERYRPNEEITETLAEKLLLNHRLARRIRAFRPEVALYVPAASASIFALFRARMLSVYAHRAQVAVITLQPREYGGLTRLATRLLRPDFIFTQAPRSSAALFQLGFQVGLIPGGVDLDRFQPVSPAAKRRLREKHGVGASKYVVLHVGHAKTTRNIPTLKAIQRQMDNQVILVASTSTRQDTALLEELRGAGLHVISRYLDRIEEIYQLADCYVFPVASSGDAIEMPLSVLEAIACNLPVVTTRFGGLSSVFEAQTGFAYVDDPMELAATVEAYKEVREVNTREMAEPYSWKRLTDRLLVEIAPRQTYQANSKSAATAGRPS